MRKYPLLAVVLLAAIVTGCGGQPSPDASSTPFVGQETAEPTPQSEPTAVPSSTSVAASTAETPSEGPASPGVAACMAADAEIPALPNLRPAAADDHARGPADAPIVLMEYSDFQ